MKKLNALLFIGLLTHLFTIKVLSQSNEKSISGINLNYDTSNELFVISTNYTNSEFVLGEVKLQMSDLYRTKFSNTLEIELYSNIKTDFPHDYKADFLMMNMNHNFVGDQVSSSGRVSRSSSPILLGALAGGAAGAVVYAAGGNDGETIAMMAVLWAMLGAGVGAIFF